VKTKTIRIKKKGGGTRLQRVQVLASGKYKFVKNPTRKASRSRPKKTTKRRRNPSMARRRRSRKSRSLTIPLATVIPVVAAFAKPSPRGDSVLNDLLEGRLNDALYDAREVFAGVDANGQFRPEWLVATYGPMVVGAMVSKFVGGKPLNINRKLAAAGIPFIRI
jgi:hypothetical protein